MTYPINHVHIKSADPKKSAQWWQKHFGAKITEEVEALPGTRTIRMAVEGNTRLFISTQPTGQTLPRGSAELHLGLEHFGFDVPDLAKELERLEKAGVKIRRPLTTIPGGLKLAFVEAPDDVLVELVETR
ncbi:MAG: VOC family protein [Chloroflexi bacterium]|nr:VOC family protein [Chloroflexota bacterium]